MKPQTIAIIAPHCTLPAMSGGDVRSVEIARAFSQTFRRCHFLGRNRFLSWEDGGMERTVKEFECPEGKVVPALKSVLTGTHYLWNKHLGAKWRGLATAWLDELKPDILYVNFLWSQPFVSRWSAGRRVFYDTHNFDPEWFGNLIRNTWNPLQKIACRNSINVIMRVLRELPSSTPLVHVSQRDAECWRGLRADLAHLVLPNGCTVRPRDTPPDYSVERKQVYFLGFLSVQMSFDALKVFEATFWPHLKDVADFHVVGARPPERIKELCRQHGWQLHANLPDDALAKCLGQMHFSCLPFTYGAGSKLKLVDAAGRGVPTVSTPAGVVGFENLPSGVFVSDDPKAWREKILNTRALPKDDVEDLLRFGRSYTWDALVSRFLSEHGALFDGSGATA